MVYLRNGRENTVVDYQKFPGEPWTVLDIEGELSAPSGSGKSVESLWGRSTRGQSEYKGSRFTSDEQRWTLDFRARTKTETWLRKLACNVNIRNRYRCGDLLPVTNFIATQQYHDAATTGRGFSADVAKNADGANDDQMATFSLSAGFALHLLPLEHQDISLTVNDTAFNQIFNAGIVQCVGDCGDELTGREDWWAVTDADATPGYQSVASPVFYWTRDEGATWNNVYIDVFTSGNATGVTRSGDRIIVVSPTNGIASARIADVYNGVANPWTLNTDVTANFPTAVDASGLVVFAVGAGGYIYRSLDGGFTWASFSAATITSNALNAVHVYSENLAYFAGNSGTLIRYYFGVAALITIQTAAGVAITGNINVVKVPPKRTRQVYVGTSAGEIWRSKNIDISAPTFTNLGFDRSGTGSIPDFAFFGPFGEIFWVIQNDLNGYSRVLRDSSGGYLQGQEEIVGTFTSPSNFGINSIAPADENFAMTAGEVHSTYAFIGKVREKPQVE